ncbi:MAG: hypothetical protein LBP86_05865 [Azoarcus sp.]|nr:hypothetical protein [Azoarcus sp.]
MPKNKVRRNNDLQDIRHTPPDKESAILSQARQDGTKAAGPDGKSMSCFMSGSVYAAGRRRILF